MHGNKDYHSSSGPGVPARLYSVKEPPSLDEFSKLCSRKTTPQDYPLAASVQANVPVYDLQQHSVSDHATTSRLQDEWNHILLSGPGVFVLKGLYPDKALLDRVNAVFHAIISSEKATSKGDHFAGAGSNDRIWNSFQKHCARDPASFLTYYSNPWLALVCTSWLGPAYRITAQVNVVKPGGAAQLSHRDYHLGFQAAEACARFPKAMQKASQLLTLQGAVAHSDMPLASGPTRFLPFSQLFDEGYMAYPRPEFDEYFLRNHVSLPLDVGDGVFFNPALFHAAGENRTQAFERSANLLQVSSAFGKPMETVETLPLIENCWVGLVSMYEEQGMSAQVEAFVGAVAEGYPFPTNLDRRPPAPGGMAPESEQEVLFRALKDGLTVKQVVGEISSLQANSKA